MRRGALRTPPARWTISTDSDEPLKPPLRQRAYRPHRNRSRTRIDGTQQLPGRVQTAGRGPVPGGRGPSVLLAGSVDWCALTRERLHPPPEPRRDEMSPVTLPEPGVAKSGTTKKDIAHGHRQPHRQELRAAHHARHDPRDGPAPDQDRSRTTSALMSYDPAFMNTASCTSRITFIDGDKGILRYRGYPIDGARREQQLPGDGLPDPERRAAHEAAVRQVGVERHPPHDGPRERQGPDDGLPLRRPPDGDAGVHGGRAQHLLSRGQGSPRPARAREADPAADRQDPDARRLRLPPLEGHALRLPGQRPELLRQLPQHDVQGHRAALPRQPGAGARLRRAVHPARRPRAELLHLRDARRRLLVRGSRTRPRRPRSAPSTGRCTAAPTSRCCGCSRRSARRTRCRRSSRR